MSKLRIAPLIKSIAIALIFFAVGRWIVIQMGDAGVGLTIGLVVIFYALWWWFYRRNRNR